MALAHCPSVLQLPGCAEPSLPGAGEAELCCQIALPCIYQPGETLSVQFQSLIFLQEDNFIIKKYNCEKSKRLILHFSSVSQILKLHSRAKQSTSSLGNFGTGICDIPQSLREGAGCLKPISRPSTPFLRKKRNGDSRPQTPWVCMRLRWSMGMLFVLELSASPVPWTWWQSSSCAVQG